MPKAKSSRASAVVTEDNQGNEQLDTSGLLHEQVAKRAYLLWEQGGRQEGTAELDWNQAKQELAEPTS
jgi:hypothetical protein